MTTAEDHERTSWIGVNAYGVFVAALVVMLSLRHMFAWDQQDVLLTHAGYIGYGITGLALLFAYARTRIDVEVYASISLVGSNVAVLIGNVSDRGFDLWSAAVTLILGVTVTARAAALIRGGVFVLPKWER